MGHMSRVTKSVDVCSRRKIPLCVAWGIILLGVRFALATLV